MIIHKFPCLRVLNSVTEYRALVHDTDDILLKLKVHAVEHSVIVLVLRRCNFFTPDIDSDVLGAVADRGAGHVHSRIACADDRDLVAQFVYIRAVQVVDRVEDMTESLSGHAQLARLPGAGSYEDAAVTVVKEILDTCGSAQFEVGTEQNAHVAHPAVVSVQNGLGKTELRNAVAKDSADLLTCLKYGDLVAAAGQNDRDRNSRGACSDNADLHTVGRCAGKIEPLEAGVGNIVFDRRKVNRLALDPADAMPFALVLMVADEGADDGQRIVFKKDLSRFYHPVLLEQADYFRNVRLNRTSQHTAAGILALQASISFINYMYGHCGPPIPAEIIALD